MPRPPRREAASGIHHVMNRGVDRQTIFFSDDDRLDFGRQLAWNHEHLGVTTLAYCLMGNHYHLVLQAPPGTLSEAMHHLGSLYTRHLNDRLGRDGPLFRSRFHSIPVEDDAYLLTVVRYVHRNPIGLPGVSGPADHRWSSYRTYRGLRPAPAFLDTGPVMGLLGGSVDQLVALTEDEGVGSSSGGIGRRIDGRTPVTATELQSLLQCVLAVDDVHHGQGDGGPNVHTQRTVLVLLADRVDDPGLMAAVEAHLGVRSPAAVRAAAQHRAERRARRDPLVARALDATLAYFAA